MKKMLLSITVTALLAGCGSGETLQDVKNDSAEVIPFSKVEFDPAEGVISVPNDLLLSGTQDGTLNIPDELDENNVSITRAAYADPSFALGALDGWSTQMPYKVDIAFAGGVSLDATSASTAGNVRIFEVVMGASLTDAECSVVAAGTACKLVGELTYGVDFITQAAGDGVTVIPLKPFSPGSSYINVLTTGLKDSLGRSIAPSSTYSLVKEEAPLITDAQLALQGVVNSYENVVVSSGSITKDDIIFSSAMTIQSAGQVMGAIKNLLAGSLQNTALPMPELSIPEQATITVKDFFDKINKPVPDVFSAVQYQRGTINLPMYLATPTGTTTDDLADTYWQGMCDSAVAVIGYKAAVGDNFPADPISESDATCAALSGGKLRDLGIDSTRHLTKYNTIPKIQSIETAPVQITKPILPVINAIRTNANLTPLSMPEAGWPVVILQHGITTQKESMLALTAQLSIQGFATVAIDHPRHGERGLDINNDGTDDFNATTGSVLSYMNLSSLLVARDSLRQSSADLLALRFGLNFSGDSTLNSKDVTYIGHSLGSIVAPSFIAQANTPLADTVDPLFHVNTVALASGGGGIASFLFESAAFGPFIQSSVLFSADIDETTEFKAFLQEGAVANCVQYAGDQEAYLTCGYGQFIASLTAGGEIEKLANIQAVFSQFVFAAQSVLDSGDPTNYAGTVKALGTPIYLNAVVGDGGENKADQVIPVTTSANPLAGTLPLAHLLGLTTASESQPLSENAASYLVKFTKGHHGSVLTPEQDEAQAATVQGSIDANAEMQMQIATYLAARGHMLLISNEDVVTD